MGSLASRFLLGGLFDFVLEREGGNGSRHWMGYVYGVNNVLYTLKSVSLSRLPAGAASAASTSAAAYLRNKHAMELQLLAPAQ